MFLDEKQCDYIIGMMRGDIPKPSALIRLSEWAEEVFGLKLYGYFFAVDTVGDKQIPHLTVVLWDYEAKNSIRGKYGVEPEIRKQFGDRFISIAEEEGCLPDGSLDRLFVSFDTIADELKKSIFRRVKPELEALKTGDVRDIVTAFGYISVFYETNEQLLRHETDGTNEAIVLRCTEIVRKYDEFGVFGDRVSCRFSSIQTLNEQYGGSLQHFFN